MVSSVRYESGGLWTRREGLCRMTGRGDDVICFVHTSSRLQPEGMKRRSPPSPPIPSGGQQEREEVEEKVNLSAAGTDRQSSSSGDSQHFGAYHRVFIS